MARNQRSDWFIHLLTDLAVHLYRTEISVVNGISGTATTTHTCLTLGEANVLDLKFLNEEFLLVLLSLKGKLLIPYP